jgi:hypothetical protein
MHDTNDKQPSNTPSFAPEDMVNASELKDFIFCGRTWFLNQHGFRVSDRAIQEREAGIAFHEDRAEAARKGCAPEKFRTTPGLTCY